MGEKLVGTRANCKRIAIAYGSVPEDAQFSLFLYVEMKSVTKISSTFLIVNLLLSAALAQYQVSFNHCYIQLYNTN